jgi:prepilin-type N-terminal cleavage/methylation domain-containing protein
MWAKNKQQIGFTIVELLIVIVVVAILAAITIVAYNGIQSRARDAERSQDIISIQKVVELYYTDKGVYPSHTQLQDPAWRVANLPSQGEGIFINPQDPGSTNSMVASGSSVALNKYSYYAVDSAGALCNTGGSCVGYRMTWKLEANPTVNLTKSVTN